VTDNRIEKFARILVDYSLKIKPGDRVAIVTTTLAEAVAKELYILTLDRGGFPHILLEIPGQDELLFAHGNDAQLEFVPLFNKMAFEEFEVLIKIRADANTRTLANVDPARQAQHQKSLAPLLHAQMRRGADSSLRWMSTLFPTPAYAMEAEMGIEEYQNFVYHACHADDYTSDPIAYWRNVYEEQQHFLMLFQGHDRVEIHGPNAELTLSVKDRQFINASGQCNLPDGEIFTGPVEKSVNGWVRYT
jgi:aminopeptidase